MFVKYAQGSYNTDVAMQIDAINDVTVTMFAIYLSHLTLPSVVKSHSVQRLVAILATFA